MATELAKLETLAKDINAEHAACETAARGAIEHAIRAGELLIEAKGQCEHGQWLPWLKKNFNGARTTAANYMRVSSNVQRVAHLPLREALKELAEERKPQQSLSPRPELHHCDNCGHDYPLADGECGNCHKPMPPAPEPPATGATRELVDPATGEVHEAKVSPARPAQPQKMTIVSKEEYEAEARAETKASESPKRPSPPAQPGEPRPGTKFNDYLRHLWRLTNSVKDAGGIEAVAAKWDGDTKRRATNEMAHLGAILTEWQNYLKETQG